MGDDRLQNKMTKNTNDRGSLGDSPVSCKSNSDNFPCLKAQIGPQQPEKILDP